MDSDLRASLVAAGAAAALSALVGMIAGVGFFILLLRALVGGLFIGAAVYGGIVLLKRTLPGLFDSEISPGRESGIEPLAAPEMGANVDIVLPGEGAELYSAEPEPLVSRPAPSGGRQNDELPAAGSEAEEAEETAYIDGPGLLEPEEVAFESEAAIPIESAGGVGGKRSAVGFDELDVLPDLDGFSDSFTASEFSSGGSSAERSNGESPAVSKRGVSPAPRNAQGNLDSVALAQAVRTILKRDQKG